MRNRRLEKERLENIGRKLFAAGALRESEIERIAAREDLFAGVLARVNPTAAEPAREEFSFRRFVRRHELAIGGAFAAVLCVGVLGLYVQQEPAEVVSRKVQQTPALRPPQAGPEIAPQMAVNEPAPEPVQDRLIDEPSAPAAPAVERTVFRQQRPAAVAQPQRASAGLENSDEPEFFPVTYTGDNGESARGGRVIRVDVSRATLFAMGINVPLENESPTVKADLLVGPDGSTRAIRLVE